MWVGAVALIVAALCLRFDVFASPDDPPCPEWRGEFLAKNAPLENVPVVVKAEIKGEGLTVTVKNEGSTTLEYSSAGRSGIQLFQEFEETGGWIPAGWDWCGTGKETQQLAPGEQVGLAVGFSDPRRERMLACFDEKDTGRSGMVVLAAEDIRLFPSVRWAVLVPGMGAAFMAFGVWLGVRIVNRRERWAKWTALAMAIVLFGYPLSMGPAWWISHNLDLPYCFNYGIRCPYEPLWWVISNGPEWVNNAGWRYLNWWTSEP
jgi:hypothetical protein